MTERPKGKPLLAILGGTVVVSTLLAAASVYVNGTNGELRRQQGQALIAMQSNIDDLSNGLRRVAAQDWVARDGLSDASSGLARAHDQLVKLEVPDLLGTEAVERVAGDRTSLSRIQSATRDLVTTAGALAALPEMDDVIQQPEGLESAGDQDASGQLRIELDTQVTQLDKAVGQLSSRVGVALKTLSGPMQWWFGVWVPLGLLGLAVLSALAAIVVYRADDSTRAAAAKLAEQNTRNQEAILRLLDELSNLADGDLTVEATVTEDITGAIADSINFAIEALRNLVITINDSAIMVDGATKQTEATVLHLARASEQQSDQISAATESIALMAASTEQVAGNAERSADVARHSVDVAHKGGDAVRRTIDGMNAIRETIQDTSKRIKRLGESSQEIGNIVELINDIAEQTNILALNASIQASMAGEAGRGFAVVADEVQRLAERSTNATKQIEVLVRTIQSDTNEAVVSMERSTTDVVGGALLAENAGAALDEIEQVSNQIASLVQNISSSARQQAGSAADVTRRTTRLREIGEQTGQATTATAASISKLSELATQLRKTVEGFTLPAEMMQASSLARTTTNADTAAASAALAVGDQAISG